MKARHFWIVALIGLLFGSPSWAANNWSGGDFDLYAGDFNGDGNTDLLYIAKDASMPSGIMLSDGSSPTIDWQSWSSDYLGIPWSADAYNVIVADFNGDGRADIFLQSKTAGDSYLLLTDDNGHVGAISQTIPNSAMGLIWSATSHVLVAGDFDGSGKAGLFLQATSRNGVNAIVLTDENGQFTAQMPTQVWGDGYLGFNWSSLDSKIYVGDFNGDGRDDLLVQAIPARDIMGLKEPLYAESLVNGVVLAGSGQQIFALQGVQQWGAEGFGVDWLPENSDLVIGDFNGDGCADVLFQPSESGGIAYLLTGNRKGPAFSKADRSLSSNVPVDSETTTLIAGRFSGGSAAGLYIQGRSTGGDNYVALGISKGIHAEALHTAHFTGASLTKPLLARKADALTTAATPATTIGKAPVTATAVGRTIGSFAVSPGGAANYSIPIQVPPGAAGIQPTLALTYRSGGENGMLGVGWALTGFSEIQRCKKNLPDDGTNDSPKFVPTDDYCLDSDRLRLTSGTAGTGGATYQTELEQFTQVTAVNSLTSGPDHWLAIGRNGWTYEYGNTSSSRDTTSPSEWLLDKVTDRYGNYMSITYQGSGNSGSQAVPLLITYTENDTTSPALIWTAEVLFSYTTRPTTDIVTREAVTTSERLTTLLTNIQTLYYNRSNSTYQVVRNYNLSYGTGASSGRSRLTAVQECDGGGNCLSPTTFGWQDGEAGIGTDTKAANLGSLAKYAMPIDINGDGRADVVYPSGTTWWYMLANPAGGYFAPVNTGIAHNGNYAKALALDYNADGKMDIVFPNASNQWEVLQSTGSGFTAINTGYTATGAGGNAWIADVNGDGYPDLVFVAASGTELEARFNSSTGFSSTATVLYTTPSGSTISPVQFASTGSPYAYSVISQGDFNGDGRTDLMLSFTTSGVTVPHVLLSTGSAYVDSGYTFNDTHDSSGNSQVMATWRALDANKDGYTDIAFVDKTGYWQISYGEPTRPAFSSSVTSSVAILNPPTFGSILALDWDGDGRVDILQATNPPPTPGTAWQWSRDTGDILPTASGGTGSFTGAVSTGYVTDQQQTMVADVNGDGLPDIVYADSSYYWHYILRNGAYPDLMTSVTDGFNNEISVTYAPLTNSAVYTKGSGAVYPEMDLQLPYYVVQNYVATNGIGSTYTVSETYSGLRVNLLRGFEGFAGRVETDSRTGIATTTNFFQQFPFTGLVSSVTSAQSSGKVIQQTSTVFTDLETNSTQYLDRHYPYPSSVTQSTYEVHPGDASDGLGIEKLVTATAVDGYGNPTTITKTTYDLTNGSAIALTAVTSFGTPTNDTVNWCLGFVTAQTQTNTVPSEPALTHTIEYVRDSNLAKCRISQKILEPNDPSPYVNLLTSTYAYDAFGHVISETASGAGFTNRVLQRSYGSSAVFPVTVTDPAGGVTTYGYNYALGLPTTLTDANNATVTWLYDTLGRKTKETRPDGTSTGWNLYSMVPSGSPCVDPSACYQGKETLYDPSSNVLKTTAKNYDSLGRIVAATDQYVTGNIATVYTNYNAQGQIYQMSRPAFASNTVYYTTYLYDVVGRKLSETRQINVNNTGTQSSTFSYQRLYVTFTDANSHATQKQVNAIGQVIAVTDPMNGVTQYQYDAFGNLLTTSDPAAHKIVSQYSIRGFRTSTSDADLGNWSYTYYPTGELNTQTDAKLQQVGYVYDVDGRPVTRTEPEGVTTWTYGSSATSTSSNENVGKVISVAAPSYSETRAYDGLSRPLTVTTTVGGISYVISNTYDSATGDLATLTYPTSTSAVQNSQFKLQYDYAYGQLVDVRDFNTPTLLYWQELATDAAGQGTNEAYGNGMQSNSTYDSITGWLGTRSAGLSSSSLLQQNSYQWDEVGNLQSREDLNLSFTESFTYDALNRLSISKLNGTQNLSLTYDATGNITSKSDVGCYGYGAACGGTAVNHAVTAAGSNTYSYDANGNMIERNGSTLSWYSYNFPETIYEGANYSTFSYGPGRARYKQVNYVAPGGVLPSGTETTIYIGGIFEQITKPSGVIEYKHYIQATGDPIAIRTLRTNAANDTRYLFKDHLSSIDTIADESGNLIQKLSYDAFGKRRSAATMSGTPSSSDWTNIAATTHRGLNFQEHLDNVGLIHLNGRVYDPLIGRFISADPTIQAAFMSQDLNRYSYVMNNPLSYVDPTGYSWLSDVANAFWGFVKLIFVVVVTLIVAYYLGSIFATATFWGLETGIIEGGNLRASLRAAEEEGLIAAIASILAWGFGQVVSFVNENLVANAQAGGGVIDDSVSATTAEDADNYQYNLTHNEFGYPLFVANNAGELINGNSLEEIVINAQAQAAKAAWYHNAISQEWAATVAWAQAARQALLHRTSVQLDTEVVFFDKYAIGQTLTADYDDLSEYGSLRDEYAADSASGSSTQIKVNASLSVKLDLIQMGPEINSADTLHVSYCGYVGAGGCINATLADGHLVGLSTNLGVGLGESGGWSIGGAASHLIQVFKWFQ